MEITFRFAYNFIWCKVLLQSIMQIKVITISLKGNDPRKHA